MQNNFVAEMSHRAHGGVAGLAEEAKVARTSPSREISYRCSEQFLPILRCLNASILISTYQAGKVAIISPPSQADKPMAVRLTNFEQPMGMAVRRDCLAVGTRREVWQLKAAHELAGRLPEQHRGTTCYVTRSSHVTGNIHVHEMAWSGAELWLANTLFSCLCTLDDEHSFVPRWQPPFITTLAADDRCHLNGFTLEDGQPKYVTVLAQTNEPQGWRPTKATSGCVLDVVSGQPVATGLCMPHSPRLHAGRLWVLNSGCGELNVVDVATGRLATVEQMPGYTRGLSLAGQFAFVGLSKIRESAVFGGLPIGQRPDELRCGVAVVDLQSGRSVAWFEFTTGIDEVFDVQILPDFGQLVLHGPHAQEDDQNELWIVPPVSPASSAPTRGL